MNYLPISHVSEEKLNAFFIEQWGSLEMLTAQETYQLRELEGFSCQTINEDLIGLVTFKETRGSLEIVSLDSLQEGSGIGSELLRLVESEAEVRGVELVQLTTTNDNIRALAFYQKRGYRITQVSPDAVREARRRKPSIPLIAANGIPISDEIRLEKNLFSGR
ncbi:GNAT family N-acetyltransferase [Halobacillus salinarum]|uniref:GNAT family N-acetyltransferase n=1 Tax=Halobacillus salinarum TaxID=2932257 RepID=A0ABY4EMC1_9BACI|nr:GNAT family N-acetyltransferase [Halobacillus salinarum]UOQ45283.1 GNAT family N-acetyltransferase [Halobacillus salinarum]